MFNLTKIDNGYLCLQEIDHSFNKLHFLLLGSKEEFILPKKDQFGKKVIC